jgi:hypothetical protein
MSLSISNGQLIGYNGARVCDLPKQMKVQNRVFDLTETYKAIDGEYDDLGYCESSPDYKSVYFAFILYEWVSDRFDEEEDYSVGELGDINAVVIAKLDLKTRKWVWTNQLSNHMVTSVKSRIMKESVFLTQFLNVISLNFCNHQNGKECNTDFNCQTGVEIVTIA